MYFMNTPDNWDRVFLFVMNSKWLITWEGGTVSGESLKQWVGWERKMLLLNIYVQSSSWILVSSSSVLIIINICCWPFLCKLLNHPHPVRDESLAQVSQDLGSREPLLEMKIGNVKKCKYLQLVPHCYPQLSVYLAPHQAWVVTMTGP